jgi:hypothetical protein
VNQNPEKTTTQSQIAPLVNQWGAARDSVKAEAMLRHIALLTGFTQRVSPQLTDLERRQVLQWLQENYPYAYLLAMSQQSVGHPAMIWGRNLSAQVTLMAADYRPA